MVENGKDAYWRAVGEAESERARSLLEGRPVGARCAQMARVLLLSSGMRTVRCHSSGVSWCQRLCWLLDERRKADAQGERRLAFAQASG